MEKKPKSGCWRRIGAALICAALACSVSLPAYAVTQETVDDLQSTMESLQTDAQKLSETKDELEAKLAGVQEQRMGAEEQLQVIQDQVDVIQAELDNMNEQLAYYDTLITEKNSEISATETAEEKQYGLYCERVRALEESNSLSYLSVLFEATDFSDLLTRFNMIDEVIQYDRDVKDQLTAIREMLQQQKQDLQTLQDGQQAAVAQQEALNEEMSAKLEEQSALVEQLQEQEAETQAQIDITEAQQAELEASIAAASEQYSSALAELAAQEQSQNSQNSQSSEDTQNSSESGSTDSGDSNYYSGDGYIWPLPGCTTITSYFGYREDPITGQPSNHSGTDIAASTGTPILASHGGVVTIAGWYGGYGNCVAIEDTNGITVIYGHQSAINVSQGQTVSQGDVIGYVGSTGYSTGPHLHFEFRYADGSRGDALDYTTPS